MEPKHSLLGIAAFVLSVLSAAMLFALFAAVVLANSFGPVDHDVAQFGRALFILCIVGLFLMTVLSLGLGIAGMIQAERKRLFAVLGVAFSGLQIAGMIFMILVLSARSH